MAKILNYRVIIEQDEDGVFVASASSIPGCYTQGDTYEEVIRNIKEAIELCLEEAKENAGYKSKIIFGKDSGPKFLGITEVAVSS